MKTRFLVFAGAALLLANGCTNANSETEPLETDATVQASLAEEAAAPDVITTSTNIEPVAAKPLPEDEAGPTGESVNTVMAPPPSIKLSPAVGEVAKLVQAGVDSNVIMAYVTNSASTFRLEADEIVYLKDLGMAPEVVTAMIQRDQRIKEAAAAGVTLPSTQPASVWAAGVVAPSNGVPAEPAPAAQPSTATTVPPPPAAEMPAPETVNYFYDSLSPYGTWVDVDGYGRCWRPTVVVTTPDWRPYSNCGRWEWTDSGWYWYSEYSWGWAPFHYGRWFSHPRWGWCWVPGSTWGPSWVSWRYSDDYCGWSPLPPAAYYSPSIGFTYYGRSCGSSFSFGLTWDCFTFVSYRNFRSHRYDRDCVPHHQAGTVYNHTTVVNNVIRGNNNTIINNGISPTRITAGGGGSIRQVTIRDGHGPRGGAGGPVVRHEEIAHGGHINTIRPTVPTGHGHPTIAAGDGPGRGGALGLTSGNGGTGVATGPHTGLVPPRVGSGGPRQTVPINNEANGSPSSSTAAHSPTPVSSTPVAGPPATLPPRTGGIKASTRGRETVWSNPNTQPGGTPGSSAAAPSPAAGSSSPAADSTPNVRPVTGGIKAPPRGNESVSSTPNTQPGGALGSLIIRTPRPPRGTKENSATPASGFTQPTVTQPSPTAPTTASTPSPARATQAPQATPWLNNTPTRNTPATGGTKAPQLAEQSGTTRGTWSTRDTRSGNNWNSGNNDTRPSAPSYVAPPVRSSPPAYQAPAAPTRSYGTPSAPQQSYSPPVRSAPQQYTPPAQPSYSAPSREVAPSRSSSPSPAPRSEPRSSSSGSSSRGSSSSKDDRPSRGR